MYILRATWVYNGNVDSTKSPELCTRRVQGYLKKLRENERCGRVPLGTAENIAEGKREKYAIAQGCRECSPLTTSDISEHP